MLVGKHRVCQQSHWLSLFPWCLPDLSFLSRCDTKGIPQLHRYAGPWPTCYLWRYSAPPTCLQTVGGCWEAAVQMEAFSGRCPVQCSCSQTIHQSHISTSPQKPLPSTGALIWGNAQPNPRAPTWGSCLNLSTLLPSVIYFASTAVHVDVQRVAHCAWSFFFSINKFLVISSEPCSAMMFFRTTSCWFVWL